MSEEKTELLPCPYSHKHLSDYEVGIFKGEEQCQVDCDCGASGPWCSTPAEAIAAWNRRAAPPASVDWEDFIELSEDAVHSFSANTLVISSDSLRSRLASLPASVPVSALKKLIVRVENFTAKQDGPGGAAGAVVYESGAQMVADEIGELIQATAAESGEGGK